MPDSGDFTPTEPTPAPLRAPAEYGFPIDASKLLPWSYAGEQLIAARDYWLVTIRPDGRPHLAPLWGVWVDNAWWFHGNPESRWGRNLALNSAASVHLESGRRVVIVDGDVRYETTSDAVARRVIDAWTDKYGEFVPAPATAPIYCLRPKVARGWSDESGGDATRWNF